MAVGCGHETEGCVGHAVMPQRTTHHHRKRSVDLSVETQESRHVPQAYRTPFLSLHSLPDRNPYSFRITENIKKKKEEKRSIESDSANEAKQKRNTFENANF